MFGYSFLNYFFGNINGFQTLLNTLNLKPAISQLYLPRKIGNRGLFENKNLCNKQLTALKNVLIRKAKYLYFNKATVGCDVAYKSLNLTKTECLASVLSIADRTAC